MGAISGEVLSTFNTTLGISDLPYANMVFSDASGMYLFALYTIVFAFIFVSLLQFKFPNSSNKWAKHFDVFVIYYLVFILLKYGIDKMFFNQFYPVNPALLYSEFGNLSKDIVFWSLAGSSKFYQFFSGVIEVLAAFLILLNRTRKLGLILALIIFSNICFINFSFDVSVKFFSLLILTLNLYATRNFIIDIFFYLSNIKGSIQIPEANNVFGSIKKWLKPLVIVLILIETTFPYLNTNANEPGQRARIYIGAYEIKAINQTNRYQNLFILENNRLVIKTTEGKMIPGKYELSADGKRMKIEMKSEFLKSAQLDLSHKMITAIDKNGNTDSFQLKALKWQNKVLKNDGFHWTVDGLKASDFQP
ncbi:MAG TPA: hypothetical protein VGF79_03905 [Bacteroidia bacterium]